MLWLYIHLPNLLLEHVNQDQAGQTPLIISAGSQGLVYQANRAARELGVRTGMRLKTAINLAPDLVVARTDSGREQFALAQQARWLYRQAAYISLYPPNGLLTEVSSLKRLYGGLTPLWQNLSQELDRRQLTGQMATALTPSAARSLAQMNRGQCTDCPETLRELAQALPIDQIGLPERTVKRLGKLGLLTLNDALSLPANEIAHRLEPETLQRLQQIHGTRPDPQTRWQPPLYFRQRMDFASDIEQMAGLLFPLQRALGELETDLQWRQQDTDYLKLSFHHRHHAETHLAIRTAGPEHQAVAFMALARIQLEQQQLAAPVMAMTLTVSRFMARGQPANTDLFGSESGPDEAWQALVGRLQARLGESAIKTLASHPDHRPEKAWTQQTLSKPGKISAHRDDHFPDAPSLPYRPLWLLRTPQAVHHLPEAWLAGPERISGGWWDGERVQRDYYIAQLKTGQLGWLFRDVSGGWYIHGWFG
ncbi:MAG: DNA polymerase Y family protein [Marinobacter sp.]|uniref:DNA polymerase Y family protein n=1 Tax=Marinobacter sp. TaxID=50741 RepID=UPI0034A0A821